MSQQVKLLLSYDVVEGHESAYRRYVVEEFLPGVQSLGLAPTDAWATAYGDYPSRLLGLVAENRAVADAARHTEKWREMVDKLQEYTQNLTLRLVRMSGGFQW
jgi:hypothetical protein